MSTEQQRANTAVPSPRRYPPGNYTLTVTVEAGFQPTIHGKDLLWINVPGEVWSCSFVETGKTPYFLQGGLAYYENVTGTASCTDPEATGRVYRGTITDGFIMASEYSLGYTDTWTRGAVSREDPLMHIDGPTTWSDSKTVTFDVVGTTPATPSPEPTHPTPTPAPTPRATLKKGKALATKALLRQATIVQPRKSTTRLAPASGSQKVCKILPKSAGIKAIKKGTCRIRVTVNPNRGKTTTTVVTVTVR